MPPLDYTTTRDIRELQRELDSLRDSGYYTTTRDIRELQRGDCCEFHSRHYTTTRDIRELQLGLMRTIKMSDYTTTRDIRELQPADRHAVAYCNYTTTRDIRELQLIGVGEGGRFTIPQQETSGIHSPAALASAHPKARKTAANQSPGLQRSCWHPRRDSNSLHSA